MKRFLLIALLASTTQTNAMFTQAAKAAARLAQPALRQQARVLKTNPNKKDVLATAQEITEKLSEINTKMANLMAKKIEAELTVAKHQVVGITALFCGIIAIDIINDAVEKANGIKRS